MQDLSPEIIIATHDTVMAQDGGDLRMISEANLHQIVFQANLMAEPVARAASVFYGICAYPVFREGNRRTAYRVAERVLAGEGCRNELPCDGIRALVQGIDAFTAEIEDVEAFMRAHAGVLS